MVVTKMCLSHTTYAVTYSILLTFLCSMSQIEGMNEEKKTRFVVKIILMFMFIQILHTSMKPKSKMEAWF